MFPVFVLLIKDPRLSPSDTDIALYDRRLTMLHPISVYVYPCLVYPGTTGILSSDLK